jgi:hypothetical protein
MNTRALLVLCVHLANRNLMSQNNVLNRKYLYNRDCCQLTVSMLLNTKRKLTDTLIRCSLHAGTIKAVHRLYGAGMNQSA